MPVPLPVIPREASTQPKGPWPTLRPFALRLYRGAILIAIIWIIHRQYARLRIDGDAPITVAEAKVFFPTAATLRVDESEKLGLFVLDPAGKQVGYVLRTSPISDKITGYAGPTDTLVALDPAMTVVGIRIRSSWDTKTHVQDVSNDRYFMKTWTGKTWDQVAGMEPKTAGIEGTSGASLTSLAIANGIQQRFRQASSTVATRPVRWKAHDVGLIAVIAVALAFAFTNLRGRPWLRRTFQVVLIGYVGFYNGQLLAQSLFSGWSAHGLPWRLAPGLVLLAAAALVLPWTSRRALYCSHVCPHGAAQELLGRFTKRKLRLPRGVEHGLRWLPAGLIGLVLAVTILNLPFDLAGIEPFDAYLFRNAGRATIAIAVGGLIAALFVPMAYCKYGCPTGLLLNFVRSHGSADHFGRRDLGAAFLLILAATLYLKYDQLHRMILHR